MSMRTALMEMANNQLDEASKYGNPRHPEYSTYVDGRKSALKGVKYEKNPHAKGSDKHLAWASGHNDWRSSGKNNKKFAKMQERAAWVPESIADEQVEAFMEATVAAVAEGEDTFVFEGKHYKAKTKKEDKLDPVGQEDDDVDNDGDVDSSDKYLKNRRKAISKSVDESMSQLSSRQRTMYKKIVNMAKNNPKGALALLQKQQNDWPASAWDELDAQIVRSMAMDEVKSIDYGSRMTDAQKKKFHDLKKKMTGGPEYQKIMRKNQSPVKSDDEFHNLVLKKVMSEERAAGTAQHGPDDATSDTFQKQMGGGRTPKEKEFVDMHKMEVGLDVNKIHDDNKENIVAALKQTPPRLGDQRTGDTSFVNPVKADIIDGITKALQQMKKNS